MSVRDLVEQTKRMEMTALALTDHNGLYGAVEFYQICLELQIKPLIGAQISLVDNSSLVLLVKNTTGYRNLCQIITEGRLRGGHLNFLCEMKDVIAHKEGLFVLSGGRKGLVSQLVLSRNFAEGEAHCNWMREYFGDSFYLEMQRFVPWDDFLNERLQRIAEKCQVPLVVSNDVHLLSKSDFPVREVLHAIDQNTLRERVRTAGYKEQYLKTPLQMRRLFAKYPEAIANTVKITSLCNFEFSLGKPVFPIMEVPDGETSQTYLSRLCLQGAKERYQPLTRKVLDRVKYELQVINDLGFTDYFLIVKDIVDFCLRESIPCVGRGSAGGSIVSYILGITFADPIRFDLYFERFLNPERTDAPDIDLDICWKSRDRVLEYVAQKYGTEKTAMICTFSTLQSRAAIREVSKTYGLPEEEIGQLTRNFPHMAKISALDETLEKQPELKRQKTNDRTYHEIIAMSKRLAGFPRHLSIHSGGVIIAPDRITNYTALEVAGKGIIISQYDMYSIERLGLVKMDLLGVRSLSIITECMELARETRLDDDSPWPNDDDDLDQNPPARPPGNQTRDSASPGPGLHTDTAAVAILPPRPSTPARLESPADRPRSSPPKEAVSPTHVSQTKFSFLKKSRGLSALDMRSIPEDDRETIELIRSGRTLGCFQLESPLVRGVLRKMQTDTIEDAVVAVAVIRPGVGDSGMKDEYILRRGGKRPAHYVHPILEPILQETYGLTIYQEQVLLIAQAVAGFSLGQADILRRAMTKKRDDKKLMHTMKSDFMAGAEAKGVPASKAEQIWEFLLRFIGFGFNKAHAATYGILAYQTAFLKRYFPVEFMTAVLNNHGGFYSKGVYIEECRRYRWPDGRIGISLLPPDVNRSNTDFKKEGQAIRIGFYPVFELAEKTQNRIVAERNVRPFTDLYDFLRRTNAGQKEAEHLIRCGAFRSLQPSEALLLMQNRSYFQNRCNQAKSEYLTKEIAPTVYSKAQRILAELELLNFAVLAHPLTLYADLIPWENMTPSPEIEAHKDRRIHFTGWYVTSRLQETATGKYMKFLSLEDTRGICEIIIFPEVFEKYAELLHGYGPFTVVGKVQSRIKGEANLIAEKVHRWQSPREVVTQGVIGRQNDLFASR